MGGGVELVFICQVKEDYDALIELLKKINRLQNKQLNSEILVEEGTAEIKKIRYSAASYAEIKV